MVDVKDFAASPILGPRGLQRSPGEPMPDTNITITAEELRDAIGTNISLAMAERLLAVAVAKVQQYAPSAPVEMKTEAAIRFAGYLGGSDFGGVQTEGIGPRSITYTPPSTNAAIFRNSGAAALLTTWRKRRGGLI